MEWTIEYKCRRCGGIDRNTRGNEDLCKVGVVEAITKGVSGEFGIPVNLISLHSCPDGGSGVSDLIGCASAGKVG